MATKYHNLSDYDANAIPSKDRLKTQRYAIVVADWNQSVTFSLCKGAIETLEKHGVPCENIEVRHVPGTFELTYAASYLQKSELYNAIIAIGCVIQGDTPHFDYICQSVSHGITELNLNSTLCPIVFSVLTTLTLQQAQDRAGGNLGNKGIEGAITAIQMANFK